MKYKYFLRGLGVGLILSALILCISYRSSRPDSNESIVDQAKELGMVFPQGTQPPGLVDEAVPTATPTPAPTRNSSGAGVTGEDTAQPEVAAASPKVAVSPEPTPESAAKSTPKPTSRPKKTVKPKSTAKPASSGSGGTGVEFKVRGGLLSSSVAREMKAAGIIQNDKKFDEYLVKGGYATKIREGVYRIPAGASYEQIAKIITRSK